jgi:hypothetical protein
MPADKSVKNNQSGGKSAEDKPKGKTAPAKNKPKWSPEEMDRMRAEDRCFNCKETGHQSRNCAEKHQAKPPKQKISVSAARYDYLNSLGMNDLATEKAEASIHSDSVHTGLEELIDPPTREPGADQVWLRAPAAEVCT